MSRKCSQRLSVSDIYRTEMMDAHCTLDTVVKCTNGYVMLLAFRGHFHGRGGDKQA